MSFRKISICIDRCISTLTSNKVSAILRLNNITTLLTFSTSKWDILTTKSIVLNPIPFKWVSFRWFSIWYSLVHMTNIIVSWCCKNSNSSIVHYFHSFHFCSIKNYGLFPYALYILVDVLTLSDYNYIR